MSLRASAHLELVKEHHNTMHQSYVLFRRFENTFVRVECSFSLALTLQSSLFHGFVHQLVRVAFCLELILEEDLLVAEWILFKLVSVELSQHRSYFFYLFIFRRGLLKFFFHRFAEGEGDNTNVDGMILESI